MKNHDTHHLFIFRPHANLEAHLVPRTIKQARMKIL